MEELEKTTEQDKLFIKGFNNGYLIAEHEPELAAQLVKVPNDHSDYFEGIVLGKQEFEMEKVRERLKGMSRNEAPMKDVDKNKGKER